MRSVIFPGALFASFPEPASVARLQTAKRHQFTDVERAIISDYFGTRDSRVRPFGEPSSLTPGAALVPGTPKRLLPEELESRLPELAPEFDRVIVRGRVLLLEVQGELIHDVIEGLRID